MTCRVCGADLNTPEKIRKREKDYYRENPALYVRMSRSDRELIQEVAKQRGTTATRWARSVLVRIAEQALK